MINILKIITYAATLLGIVILSISLLELRKVQKKLKKVSNTGYFKASDKLGVKKYLKLGIIGISITSIMELIRIFLL